VKPSGNIVRDTPAGILKENDCLDRAFPRQPYRRIAVLIVKQIYLDNYYKRRFIGLNYNPILI
jgi:hypothetical protein